MAPFNLVLSPARTICGAAAGGGGAAAGARTRAASTDGAVVLIGAARRPVVPVPSAVVTDASTTDAIDGRRRSASAFSACHGSSRRETRQTGPQRSGKTRLSESANLSEQQAGAGSRS